jgi:hypothetical protein
VTGRSEAWPTEPDVPFFESLGDLQWVATGKRAFDEILSKTSLSG